MPNTASATYLFDYQPLNAEAIRLEDWPEPPTISVKTVVFSGDTKPFLAALMVVLRMHDRGIVNLDEPLTGRYNWLPPQLVEGWKRECPLVEFGSITMRKVFQRVCQAFQLDMPTEYDVDYVLSVNSDIWPDKYRLAPANCLNSFLSEMNWNDRKFPWNFVFHSAQWARINADYRYYPRDTVDWRLWEIARIDAEGLHVPWRDKLEPIPGHYARLSTDEKYVGMILYYPDATKAERGVPTPIRPGRYLTRFYSHVLDAKAVQAMQALVDNASKVQFATSEADVVRVYIYGPRSCMSNGEDIYTEGDVTPWGAPVAKDKWYVGDVHPAAVYAESPDLQLAYMCDSKGRPNARVLVWPDRKLYGCVYGDEHRIVPRLEAMGYRRAALNGARIRRIPIDGHMVVMPYIDDSNSFGEYDDRYFVIGGSYGATRTDGVAYLEEVVTCCDCDADILLDDAISIEGCFYCDDCASNSWDYCDYTYDYCAEAVDVVRGLFMSGGFRYVRCNVNLVGDYAFYCDFYEQYFDRHAFHPVEMADGSIWSNIAFDRHGVEIGGKRYPKYGAPEDNQQDCA